MTTDNYMTGRCPIRSAKEVSSSAGESQAADTENALDRNYVLVLAGSGGQFLVCGNVLRLPTSRDSEAMTNLG